MIIDEGRFWKYPTSATGSILIPKTENLDKLEYEALDQIRQLKDMIKGCEERLTAINQIKESGGD